MPMTPAEVFEARNDQLRKSVAAMLAQEETPMVEGRLHIPATRLPSGATLESLRELFEPHGWKIEEVGAKGEATTFAFSAADAPEG